jgi:UrcA family protein
MFYRRAFVVCVFGAICFSALVAPAAAVPSSVAVRFGDVDANTEAGAERLLRRVERAAREVCGEEIARRYMSTRRAYRRCVQSTMLDTVDRIGSEHLHSEFVTRYGHS